MVEVWNMGEKICDFSPNHAPQLGDVFELTVEGETGPYEVKKIYHYYPANAKPIERYEVAYCGNNFAGIA